MKMVMDSISHTKYWDLYESTDKGQRTYFGSHSENTKALDNMPNGKKLGLRNGTICLTSDGLSYIWDRVLENWIEQ